MESENSSTRKTTKYTIITPSLADFGITEDQRDLMILRGEWREFKKKNRSIAKKRYLLRQINYTCPKCKKQKLNPLDWVSHCKWCKKCSTYFYEPEIPTKLEKPKEICRYCGKRRIKFVEFEGIRFCEYCLAFFKRSRKLTQNDI